MPEVKVDYDRNANAAAITFAPFPRSGHFAEFPIFDEGGLTAIVTFVDGKLVQIQLLEASTQLPAELVPEE